MYLYFEYKKNHKKSKFKFWCSVPVPLHCSEHMNRSKLKKSIALNIQWVYTVQYLYIIHNFIQHTANLPYLSYKVTVRGHVHIIVNHLNTNTHIHKLIHCAPKSFQILRARNG